ncbi:MAG: 3-deoxy-D-manno-octulosonic acid transferase [Desulfosalsimonas sp.]
MNLFYTGYTVLASFIFLLALPFALIYAKITGKYRDHLEERMGRIPEKTLARLKGSPRIWIHAVSLGEVRVAEAVIAALEKRMPECSVLLSTTTKHGRELAESLDPENIPVIYAPLDLAFCLRPALSRVKPGAVIFIETEIWPAWVFEARRAGARVAMINGRISPRSFTSYRRMRPFLKHVLARFDVFSMIQPADRERIIALGAPPQKVVVSGNAKYERIAAGLDPDAEARMRQILDMPENVQVIVAGSTREDEEEIILDAYEKILKIFPGTILVIAPRHIERAGAIAALINRKGHCCEFRTRIGDKENPRKAKIVIVDTFGELFDTYSLATVVFCGASLVPLGGQNPFEPAAWGKPVLYGPSMEDFTDAREMLEAEGGGMTVQGPDALAAAITQLLKDPKQLQSMGENAGKAVFKHRGAGDIHASYIEKLLTDKGGEAENAD